MFDISTLTWAFKKKYLASVIRLNIALIFLLRILGIVASFALVRVSLDFLGNNALYGLWLTILSVVSWINFFDLGLGNGLRNKLTESLAKKDFVSGKYYVSTAYVVMGCLIGFFTLFFVLTFRFIPWDKIFPGSTLLPGRLAFLMLVVVLFTVIRFFLSLINSVAYAHHDSFLPALIGTFTSVLFLFSLLLFRHFSDGDIFTLAWLHSLITSGVLLVFSLILFAGRYREVRPSFRCYKPGQARNLFSLGIKFFIIQIAALVIFTTDNLIIVHVLGPEEVVPYQISHKLFSIFPLMFGIILTPFWSAFTEAYSKNEIRWIKKSLKRLLIWLFFSGSMILMLFFLSPAVIHLWLGGTITPSSQLIFLMAFYTLISMWNNIFAFFLNGIGRVKLQLITAIIAGIINIPLSIFFATSMTMGNAGVILGTIVSLSIFALLGPLDTWKAIQNKGKNLEAIHL